MSNPLDFEGEYQSGYEYGYGGSGLGDNDGDEKNEIDCSHLVWEMLKSAGYNVPYQTTAQLRNSPYFEIVTAASAKPGDLALWSSHVGIVATVLSPGKGTFFGSQTSTGPARAAFGSGYWGNPIAFLRVKEQYYDKNKDKKYVAPPETVQLPSVPSGYGADAGQSSVDGLSERPDSPNDNSTDDASTAHLMTEARDADGNIIHLMFDENGNHYESWVAFQQTDGSVLYLVWDQSGTLIDAYEDRTRVEESGFTSKLPGDTSSDSLVGLTGNFLGQLADSKKTGKAAIHSADSPVEVTSKAAPRVLAELDRMTAQLIQSAAIFGNAGIETAYLEPIQAARVEYFAPSK